MAASREVCARGDPITLPCCKKGRARARTKGRCPSDGNQKLDTLKQNRYSAFDSRGMGLHCILCKNLNRGQDTRANRTRHTTSSSTQPHAMTQNSNPRTDPRGPDKPHVHPPPRGRARLSAAVLCRPVLKFTHTHLPIGERCQSTDDTAPHRSHTYPLRVLLHILTRSQRVHGATGFGSERACRQRETSKRQRLFARARPLRAARGAPQSINRDLYMYGYGILTGFLRFPRTPPPRVRSVDKTSTRPI